jgi:hypothetical protein
MSTQKVSIIIEAKTQKVPIGIGSKQKKTATSWLEFFHSRKPV